MFGTGQEHFVVALVNARDLLRTGSMRALAEYLARKKPAVAAISRIGAGDARSLATRFGLQWVYRGRQALFWDQRFSAIRVDTAYVQARLPLRRTGLIEVEGMLAEERCTLALTEVASESAAAQLDSVVNRLLLHSPRALVCIRCHPPAIALAQRGLARMTPEQDLQVFARGFDPGGVEAVTATI